MELTRPDEVLIPLDAELQERVSWLVRVRWMAGLGLVGGSLVGMPLIDAPVPFPVLTAIGVAVLGYNQLLFLFSDRLAEALRSQRQVVHLQIALDWAALTAVVALTGGITSPATIAYVFHLIIGAILLPRRACYLLATAVAVLMALMASFTPLDLLRSIAVTVRTGPRGAQALFELWIALAGLYGVTTYLATSITARLREKEDALTRSERSLDRAYHGMASLYQLGQLVNSTVDVAEVLSLIARHATRLLHGRAAAIRLLDASGRTLSLVGSWGLSDAYLAKGPVEVENSRIDSEALQGATVMVYDVGDDGRFQYPEDARREGLRSLLSCPMRAQGRTLGVIRVYTSEPHVFSEHEQNLLRNLANLGAVAIENARRYSDLRTLDEERLWFARTTHHQLRAPLAAVQGAIDALPFAGPLTSSQADLVTRARRRVQDAFDTIRDLLDLAAAQRVDQGSGRAPVALTETLARTLEAVRDRCEAKGLLFEASVDADCVTTVDPADVERIVANLLDNAVKYTAVGRVSLVARTVGGWLELVVEDTGIGIAPDDRARVFEGFFRATAAKAMSDVGTGLGLSIVKKLVTRLGGAIAIESEVGRGTRFTVRVPVSAR